MQWLIELNKFPYTLIEFKNQYITLLYTQKFSCDLSPKMYFLLLNKFH